MRDVAGSLFVLEQGKTLYQSKKGLFGNLRGIKESW
jgi:hypothetical protein